LLRLNSKGMIQFTSHGIPFQLRNKSKVKQWIREILVSEGKQAGELAFVFCDDAYLAEMNLRYLNHTTLTDIITFDYSEKKALSGDILISIDRVQDNSEKYSTTFNDELGRVMAHGVLHLIGYNDKTTEQKVEMRDREEKYKRSFPNR